MDTAQLNKEQLIDLVVQQGQRIDFLEQQLRLIHAKQYGRQSEKISPDQYDLFDKDLPKEEEAAEEEDAITETRARKRRGKRKPCDKALERHRIDYELSPEQRQCGCGGELKKIDEVISEQYEVIPVRYLVIEHAQHKYACPCCQENIQLAAKPAQTLPKSNAGPGLLAHIATTKYVDGVPLHRQEKQHERGGIVLPRNTMSRWMIQLAELIIPLINLFEDAIRAGPFIQCDETTQQVLKEANRKASQLSYMWVRYGGLPGYEVIIYTYHPGRGSNVALSLFEGYQGYVQCDGYSGYQCLEKQGIILLGCLAHARRKYVDALKGLAKGESQQKSKAGIALAFIKSLYAIETEAKDFTPEARYQLRQEKAVPILNEFKTWLDEQNVLPKSPLGKAINYSLNQWSKLIRYCDNGCLHIDNNRDERAIRPFAISRKNFLFSDTEQGAHTNARFFSLIETAKLHGLEPYAYLKHIFKELPLASTLEDYEKLLPWKLDADNVRETAKSL